MQKLESVIETRFGAEKDRLATKEDVIREIGGLRAEMKEQKSDIINWMFIFLDWTNNGYQGFMKKVLMVLGA
jgi:hypothetical protein